MIPTAQVRRAVNPMLVLLTASTGCAMTVLDTNVVGIVLPTIARDLGASFADIEWVIGSYVLCFASLLLPAGSIADRFGRRRVFFAGVVFFAVASILCGIATTALGLSVARALQGVGAAFLLAPALAIIGHSFHGEAERSRAWAIWGGMMGLTMALSPIIGGVIANLLGWRWAFFINAPICIALCTAVVLLIEESRDPDAGKPDPAGIALFALSMFFLTAALIYGQEHGWGAPVTLIGFALGICGFALFVAVERAQVRPMLDLQLFRRPAFIGAVLAMFAYAGSAQVMASLLPQFLQNGMGRGPLEAGFAMLPFALAMLAFPYVGRKLGRRLVSRQVLVLGLLVVAAGNALTSWGASLGQSMIVMVGMLILGAGGGLLNGETQKAIMGVAPRDRAGMASGISTTSRFSGILLAFALLSGILSTATRGHLTASACRSGAGCTIDRRFADAVVSGDLPQALAGLTGTARELAIAQAQLAYRAGFSTALIAAAIGAAIAAILVGRLMREVR
ncbi:MFS transporter [Sphingomonas sp. H39-1-10]|uniref:MFS transporter n=1 Tax=Sphingomonadales TaxID=204457 RepID=UPI000C20B050|nr:MULTISPECIES: MFS transporter [Sphingomonadaceae]MDF0490109.1 MFS transporter [Sphingomonas pollutisoli]PJG45470.1 MFS transporter [Sphingobium sp. LB126]